MTKSLGNVTVELPTRYPGGNPANNWIYRSGDQQNLRIEL